MEIDEITASCDIHGRGDHMIVTGGGYNKMHPDTGNIIHLSENIGIMCTICNKGYNVILVASKYEVEQYEKLNKLESKPQILEKDI